jgi:hypothetical protein
MWGHHTQFGIEISKLSPGFSPRISRRTDGMADGDYDIVHKPEEVPARLDRFAGGGAGG